MISVADGVIHSEWKHFNNFWYDARTFTGAPADSVLATNISPREYLCTVAYDHSQEKQKTKMTVNVINLNVSN